ncbi:MAG: hypothetical protein CMJ64_27330 [Planctomycetaceae bacterium]|nr:hypothetical protein [Planctomycetaceae bacterium]
MPAIAEAQQTLSRHDSGGKRFVPGGVDFAHPVYEVSFDKTKLSCAVASSYQLVAVDKAGSRSAATLLRQWMLRDVWIY